MRLGEEALSFRRRDDGDPVREGERCELLAERASAREGATASVSEEQERAPGADEAARDPRDGDRVGGRDSTLVGDRLARRVSTDGPRRARRGGVEIDGDAQVRRAAREGARAADRVFEEDGERLGAHRERAVLRGVPEHFGHVRRFVGAVLEGAAAEARARDLAREEEDGRVVRVRDGQVRERVHRARPARHHANAERSRGARVAVRHRDRAALVLRHHETELRIAEDAVEEGSDRAAGDTVDRRHPLGLEPLEDELRRRELRADRRRGHGGPPCDGSRANGKSKPGSVARRKRGASRPVTRSIEPSRREVRGAIRLCTRISPTKLPPARSAVPAGPAQTTKPSRTVPVSCNPHPPRPPTSLATTSAS